MALQEAERLVREEAQPTASNCPSDGAHDTTASVTAETGQHDAGQTTGASPEGSPRAASDAVEREGEEEEDDDDDDGDDEEHGAVEADTAIGGVGAASEPPACLRASAAHATRPSRPRKAKPGSDFKGRVRGAVPSPVTCLPVRLFIESTVRLRPDATWAAGSQGGEDRPEALPESGPDIRQGGFQVPCKRDHTQGRMGCHHAALHAPHHLASLHAPHYLAASHAPHHRPAGTYSLPVTTAPVCQVMTKDGGRREWDSSSQKKVSRCSL